MSRGFQNPRDTRYEGHWYEYAQEQRERDGRIREEIATRKAQQQKLEEENPDIAEKIRAEKELAEKIRTERVRAMIGGHGNPEMDDYWRGYYESEHDDHS